MSAGVYLDTSALVKLVRPEAETKALFVELSRWKQRTSSALCRVELYRTLRRADADEHERRRGDAALSRLILVDIDTQVLQGASEADKLAQERYEACERDHGRKPLASEGAEP